jgi:hypothetical protein
MATIKITTANLLPRFVHGGLTVTNGWTDLDLDTLTDDQRDALTRYTGTHIRVHDESADAYRSFLSSKGMRYEDGKVVDPAREESERKRIEADEAARAAARGSRPTPPRDDTQPQTAGGFQAPPGADRAREIEPTTQRSGDVVRETDRSGTKPRPR